MESFVMAARVVIPMALLMAIGIAVRLKPVSPSLPP